MTEREGLAEPFEQNRGHLRAVGERLFRVLRFTFTRGKISGVEVIADPARLRALDLAIPNGS